MTDKDKLEKVKAEIERVKEWEKKQAAHTYGNLCQLHECRSDMCDKLLSFIDSMQEEPIPSVWHDANTLPSDPKAVVIEHNEYSTSICRAEQMSRVKGAQWAYIDDLLNLSNVERIGKDWKEEPVSTKDKLWGLSDGKRHLGWLDDADALEEPVSERFAFKAIPRLLEMIEPTDRAKAYTAKLADTLEVEGYSTDAKIVRESLKIMNGEKVPMATMDEEPVSDDLEKAIDDYIYTHDGRKRLALELDWKCCNLTLKGGDEIIKFAKHFFELGLKAQKGE